MARSASEGVDRATKAYPTGREVRGLVGIVVDSLQKTSGSEMDDRGGDDGHGGANLHQVALEEFLQLPLGCRVREISNVKSPALGGAGDDSLILGCVVGGSSLVAGAVVIVRSGVVEGGGCQLGGNVLNRIGHGEGCKFGLIEGHE